MAEEDEPEKKTEDESSDREAMAKWYDAKVSEWYRRR